jgi:D-alanyl-D-alanine carboxypeptidase (penicillin-binding protein 5/6)
LDDAPAPTRRDRRVDTGALSATDGSTSVADGVLTLDPDAAAAASANGSLAAAEASVPSSVETLLTATSGSIARSRSHTALAWIDDSTLTRALAPGDLAAAATGFVPVDVDLLSDAPHRSPFRAGVIVPTLLIAGLVGAYSATTLLWPLHAVTPEISAVQVQPVAAAPAAPPWPATGSAAVSVAGIPGALGSTTDATDIASITKVVTALAVLDEMPLAVGEQGPAYAFTAGDRQAYWSYRRGNESALDVPVGGALSEYQMLEGMLIGSANNYADRLASTIWPSDAVYADAANDWLTAHGVTGVTVVEPTGMDPDNRATPEGLLTLAQKALANPVIAEIVAKTSTQLPGAGVVENTNGLLADPGVVGIKTGTLEDSWNLLTAKDVAVGDTTVRLYAAVLGQEDDEARLAASRALYSQVEQELQPTRSVPAGTLAGHVETAWGEPVDIVTAEDASVILWNGISGSVSTTYGLADSRAAGDSVGSLSVTGPLDSATVDLRLAGEVEAPSAWWRLTHPLELFGLTD